jgi:hypothetical protein
MIRHHISGHIISWFTAFFYYNFKTTNPLNKYFITNFYLSSIFTNINNKRNGNLTTPQNRHTIILYYLVYDNGTECVKKDTII